MTLTEGSRELSDAVRRRLSSAAAAVASQLPDDIFRELLLGRDSHGNVALSSIDTETLLAELVGKKLSEDEETRADMKQTRKTQPTPHTQQTSTYQPPVAAASLSSISGVGADVLAVDPTPGGVRYRPVSHFCGYEGRAGLPTNFDATYAYALGYAAAMLAAGGAHGTVACVTNPTSPPKRWKVAGVPLCRLMRSERRAGKDRLVIRKVMVDLEGPAFARFASQRDSWRRDRPLTHLVYWSIRWSIGPFIRSSSFTQHLQSRLHSSGLVSHR